MKRTDIVTKDSLRDTIAKATVHHLTELYDGARAQSYIIGKALAALYKRQTWGEQSSDAVRVRNGIGFAKNDARIGSIGARQFNLRVTQPVVSMFIDPWVLELWIKVDKTGYPRICKYASQLNDIAIVKRQATTYLEFGKKLHGDVLDKGSFSGPPIVDIKRSPELKQLHDNTSYLTVTDFERNTISILQATKTDPAV